MDGSFFSRLFFSKFVRLNNPAYFLLACLKLLFSHFVLINSSSYLLQPMRKSYTELFYPLNGIFRFYILSVICFIKFLVEINKYSNEALSIFGLFSLPIYLFHTIIISYVLPVFSQVPENFSLIGMFVNMLLFYCLIYFYNHNLRKKLNNLV